MRRFINIADSVITDSFQDDTESVDADRLETNINLEIGDFAEEDALLAKQYMIFDTATQKAVHDYTAGSEINGHLIQAAGDPYLLPPRFRTEYTLLNALRGLVALGEEHHVYSGTGTFNPMEVTEAGVFRTPAFLSTSLSMKVAVKTTNYRREEGHVPEDHVLHFILPQGFTGGFYVARYSVDPEELEFLLFPSELFRHVKSQNKQLGEMRRTVHTFKPF